MKTNETAPVRTDAASGSLTTARSLDCPQSSWSRQWPRVVERRRAARELDRLLGVPSRPNVTEVYGLEVRDVR